MSEIERLSISVRPAEDEKPKYISAENINELEFDEKNTRQLELDLNVTAEELITLREHARTLSDEETREVAADILATHEFDPNFPRALYEKFEEYIKTGASDNADELVQVAKLGVALVQTNSPYSEVRAVVDNTDDPNAYCSTIRAWGIGIIFLLIMTFCNQLFGIRQPSISVTAVVAQLLAYPVGTFAARVLPDVGFTFRGVRHSLNPGPFNRKEHMLITIMANAGYTRPYSNTIIWTQFLKKYFNQSWAGSYAYQILLAVSTDLMGYGLAGICRSFLIYPIYCIFPQSLVTIALNRALHSEDSAAVLGPFNKIFSLSRFRWFLYAFSAMFVYFWFPDYIFTALSVFNWLAWIDPTNINLVAVTGINKGLGFNPIPTFDWNMVITELDPLVVPFISTFNALIGMLIGGFMILGFWYSNSYYTGYLPINSNGIFTHNGTTYDVSQVLDDRGILDEAKYQAYSPVYMAASNLIMYFAYFASYSATLTYAYLYHRKEIVAGLKNLFKRGKRAGTDVHSRLMSSYTEVPEWWFFCVQVVSVALGIGAILGWPTYTNVGVVFYGIFLALFFLFPIGVIYATTGIAIELNVLAEFIGGALQPGNALAMNFFKTYGYVTVSHALSFLSDMKLAHYTKIPQKQLFWAQMISTVISALIATAILNFQMREIPDVCVSGQKDKFTCPGISTFFTAAVMFGSLGAKRTFGKEGLYSTLLIGFPVGFVLPIMFYFLHKRFPKTTWLRNLNPLLIIAGGRYWSPYNLAYLWPAVPVAWFSMVFLKTRYLAFWARYNYATSAAFSAAMAVAAVIIFFALEFKAVDINWWGNNADSGCESTACPRLTLPKGTYFGPGPGQYS